MKSRKTLWIVGAAVALLIILTLIFKKGDKISRVNTEMVSKRTITEVVSVNGKIQPESAVKISADVSGEIIQMAVKEGDSVVAGQMLLRINPDLYETQVNQLQANLDNGLASLAGQEAQLESVRAALLQAESNYNRIKKLYEQKVSSEQEYEQARLQYETAKANLSASQKNIQAAKYTVQSLKANLAQGSKNLGRTQIYAPASGIITNLNSEQGERVVGTAQMAGTEIMRISNLNSMEVEVNVNDNDIVRIESGDSADIEVDAWPDRVFKGIVTEIANSAKFEATGSITEQATNYVVKVRILPSSYADLGAGRKQPFKPGMTANVDIKTQTRKDVICVPIASVITRDPSKGSKEDEAKETAKDEKLKTWVFIFKNGEVKSVEVKTGLQDIDYFEITEGLKGGEEVVAGPVRVVAKELNDGDKVKKAEKGKEDKKEEK